MKHHPFDRGDRHVCNRRHSGKDWRVSHRLHSHKMSKGDGDDLQWNSPRWRYAEKLAEPHSEGEVMKVLLDPESSAPDWV